MRRLGYWAAALAVALSAMGSWTPGHDAHADSQVPAISVPDHFELAEQTDVNCLEPVPDIAAVAAISDDASQNINLDVRILLDGVSQPRAQAIINDLAQTFAPSKITLVPTFQTVSFTGLKADALMAQARALYGGVRPAGIDVVHVLTKKNLQDAAGSELPAGAADCIGGIKNPGFGFSVSESYGAENFRVGPLYLYWHAEAKVAGHEIAHLLGGQHHLANCVEGVPTELNAPEVSPCTLMFNTVELASFNLSAANARVVRAYAFKYARP